MSRVLSHARARALYDALGRLLETQLFYERDAMSQLAGASRLGSASNVLEFGCGTGRFADEMLDHWLPANARYVGLDVSGRMVQIASGRVARFGERARVVQVEGDVRLRFADGTFDRFVSTYVLDLLSDEDGTELLREAHRVLSQGALLCLASLTPGQGVSRLISRAWQAAFRLDPLLVGGCRPIRLARLLEPGCWRIEEDSVLSRWGITSEILVASSL
jgi:ubiquinone/menaquinone biosynthesis C-methylase UbiE